MNCFNDHFFSLKEFLDFFAHVPCAFFGEGEREEMGGVDVFLFGHAILAVMVVVLPVPAPARISWGDCVCFMASS